MAEAYTPGLIVTDLTIIRKERRLPLQGEVVVKLGNRVDYYDIIARTKIPGDVREIDAARTIGIEAGSKEMGGEQLSKYMLKNIADTVKENELIARLDAFFGLIKKECRSPIDGVIENISDLTGKVLIRAPAIPVEIKSYIPGIVKHIYKNEGAIIETRGSLIQGIFGIGGETNGIISIAVDAPSEILSENKINYEHKDKIIVGGRLVTLKALEKALAQLKCSF